MKKTNSVTGLHRTLTYLLELVSFGLILIPVRVLPISHAQPPHGQDAVDVVPHPSILMVRTSWKQPRNWILTMAEEIKKKHYYLKSHLSVSKGNKTKERAKDDFTLIAHCGCSQFCHRSEVPSFFPELTQVKCKISLNTLGYKAYGIQLGILIYIALLAKSLSETWNTLRK